jgi:hypothetical protein
VSRYFNNRNTFEVSNGALNSAIPNATHTVGFTDETKLESAINNDALPAGTQAILFDIENWP